VQIHVVFLRSVRRFLTWRDKLHRVCGVSESYQTPLLNVLRWLTRHAGYPQSRLPVQAERLLLLTVAAQGEEAVEKARPSYLIQSSDSAMQSALRQHTERRRRTHYKCDNSAKV